MNKEELKKEAKEKASIYVNRLHTDNGNVSDTPFSAYDVFVAYEKGALDFAEPREKQIAHLEQSLLEVAEKSVERVDNLTKENTELKLKLEALDEQTPWKDIRDKSKLIERLTKATELIEDMYDAIPSSHSDYYKDVMERARQYLSEVEK